MNKFANGDFQNKICLPHNLETVSDDIHRAASAILSNSINISIHILWNEISFEFDVKNWGVWDENE